MLLKDVQTHLNGVFNQVSGAVNFREAIKQPLNTQNAAFIVPVSERPAGNSRDEDIGRPLQEVTVTFGVVIGIQSKNDKTGEKGMVLLEVLRKETREALHGWTPPGKHSPILIGPGDIISFVDGGLWWLDRFTTNTWHQGTH